MFLSSSTNQCNIYEIRPFGCRFYPIIYDPNNNRCILDQDCPHQEPFSFLLKNDKTICNELKKWIKEELIP